MTSRCWCSSSPSRPARTGFAEGPPRRRRRAILRAKEIEMPTVLIEVRRQYTREQELGLIEAVHAALVDAFKINPGDRNVRLVVHEPHRFACPRACEKPDAF